MTQVQARMLCESFEIENVLENEEEVECLEMHNPELLEAYRALLAMTREAGE